MADISITANLQIPQSTNRISNDLKQVSEQLNSKKALQIVGNINLNKTQTRIQSQLNNISSNLKLNIGDITFGSTNQIQTQFNNITSTANNASKAINNVKSNLVNLESKFTSPIKPVFDSQGLIDAEKTIQKVQEMFSDLGVVSVNGKYGDLFAQDGLEQLKVKITAATGEVRTLTFQLNNTGESFAYINSTLQNEGMIKHLQAATAAATKLQTKLDSIEASYSDTNSSKVIKNTSNITALESQYDKVKLAIEAVKNADVSSFATMQANADKEIAKLKEMVAQFQNAEYAATSLRTKDIATIKSEQLNNLERFISKINESGVEYPKMAEDVTNLKAALNSAFDSSSLTQFLNMFSIADAKFKSLAEEANAAKISVSQVETKINKLNSIKNSNIFANNSNNQDVRQQIISVDNLIEKYNQLKIQLSTAQTPEAIASINTQISVLENEFTQAVASATQLQQALKNTSATDNLRVKIQKLTADIQTYMNANTRMMNSNAGTGGTSFANQLQGMLAQLETASDPVTYNQIANNFRVLKSQVKFLGLEGETAFGSLIAGAKKFAKWMGTTTIISGFVRSIRDMIDNVIDLDTALTNLKKVTDETDASYEKFTESAKKTAKELKIGLANLINQEAEWAKKGFSVEEAEILAEASGMYSVVGEVDDATAVQDLTTIMKSYNMAVDESIDIVDRFNNISNKYSVTASDIGEMLSNSISSLSVAGNSLDEAIAMGTTITEITGDASEAGNTLKVLSMRLRGAATEIEAAGESTDGMAESTSKLQEKILALTNIDGTGGFDIMADADNFKSTYEIMQGIANVWEDISDVNQAALIELIAGKQRGNTVSALLTNMAQANNILNDSLNSSGSAAREYELYLDSLEGRIQGFKTSVESLSQTVINSDFLKYLVDRGTDIIEIIEWIISHKAALVSVVAGIVSIKNVGRTKMFVLV